MSNPFFSLLLVLSFATTLAAETSITRGPYLQLAHEDGITIVWRTQPAMRNPVVAYWKAESDEVKRCGGENVLSRTTTNELPLSSAPEGTVQYEATISGLESESAYHYAIYDGDKRMTEEDPAYRFVTHPVIGEPRSARIWVVGDSGTGAYHQRMVHEAMMQYTATTKRPLDLYLHVGDMAYANGTDPQFQNNFFKPYQVTLRNIVCWAAMGNHEGGSSNGNTCIGPYYDAYVSPTGGEAGGVPSNNEAFYSFDFGNIHFIGMNSHDISRKPDGRMAKWLRRDLAATKGKWIVAFWHHPPYTKGTHDSDREGQLIEMREHIMPILEDGGVDVVLSGHSHIYERSMLIDGAYQTPTTADGVILDDGDGRPNGDGPYRKSGKVTPHNGTVAIVTGHGGKLGSDSRGIIPLMRSIVLDHGSTIIDIEGDTLTGTMLDLRGKERDRFQIVKQGEVKHTVVEKPWTPTPATEERTGANVRGAVQTREAAERARAAGRERASSAVPAKVSYLVPRGADWFYLAPGEKPESEMWCRVGLDPKEEGWNSGKAGFGYGDGDDRTVLEGLNGTGAVLYIRHEFEIPEGTDLAKLGLAIDYDDGFVLHVNGKQLFAKQIVQSEDGAISVAAHEAGRAEYYPLAEFADAFKVGSNVIAFEGHNWSPTSSDFTLHPALVVEGGE